MMIDTTTTKQHTTAIYYAAHNKTNNSVPYIWQLLNTSLIVDQILSIETILIIFPPVKKNGLGCDLTDVTKIIIYPGHKKTDKNKAGIGCMIIQ